MIRLKDLSLQNRAGLGISCFLAMAKKYNPLINYDWSTTTTSGLRYLKDVGSTPTYNASMYFGRGAYLNGVDQTITVPINTTIQTALKRVNGVVTINEASQTLTNYVISGLGIHKDYYLFTRLLTQSEKDSYTNTPELFYAMAQADSTCVLNMPMSETSSTVRNYKTGIDYPITNYTSSVRDNAKNLQYGLQTCKFVRDSLGVIQSASNYLEFDKAGYADTNWMPSVGKDWSIELICQSKGVTDFGVQHTGWLIISQSQGNKYFIYIKGALLSTVNSYLYGSKVYLSLVYTEKLKTLALYENSIYVNSVPMDTSIYPLTINFLLGKRNGGGQLSECILRLFKVHNKELTQAEITANYNSYVAKGLLV